MPAPSDIAFECPACDGPLIADAAHAGLTLDCPHCFQPLVVPKGHAVSKGSYVEPLGLRRILEQVRDHEWEAMRRKLRVALAQASEMEGLLRRSESALAEAQADAASTERLHGQLTELNERFAQANAMFEAARKQHERAAAELQHDLDASRAEASRLRHENVEFTAKVSRGNACGQTRLNAKQTGRLAIARG